VAGFSEKDPHRRRDQIYNHHVFGLGDCVEIQAPQMTFPKPGTTDPLGYYAPKLKVSARYKMPKLLHEDDQEMELELAFLFTAYNKDPSHEPGGVIVDLDGWFSPAQEEGFLSRVDTNPVAYLFRDFSEIWNVLAFGQPGWMLPNADPLIWMSLTAWGPGFKLDAPPYDADDVLPAWGGTLFPNGIFFPHEDPSALDGTDVGIIPGGRNVQYPPETPLPRWRR
jgi:hypothetical protein